VCLCTRCACLTSGSDVLVWFCTAERGGGWASWRQEVGFAVHGKDFEPGQTPLTEASPAQSHQTLDLEGPDSTKHAARHVCCGWTPKRQRRSCPCPWHPRATPLVTRSVTG
jgi:hypothetical protein